MSEYAFDFVSKTAIIEPGASRTFSFTSPTPGKIHVLLKAIESLYAAPPMSSNEDSADVGSPAETSTAFRGENRAEGLSPGSRNVAFGTRIVNTGSNGGDYQGANGNQSNDIALRRMASNRLRLVGDQFGSIGDIGPIDPLPPLIKIDPRLFTVEVLDASDDVRSSASYIDFLTPIYIVPEPSPHTVPAEFGFGSKWKIRLTNNSELRARVDLTIKYPGHRPILSKPINLDFINEKLDLIFNNQQPIQITFYNEKVEAHPSTNNLPVPHTFVSVDVKEEWMELYPTIAQKIFDNQSGRKDLGYKIFRNNFSTERINVKATIHDGSLAFKVRLDFPYNSTSIDVLDWLGSQDYVGPIFELIDIFTDEIVTIKDFRLEAFFVLRTQRVNQWINPPNFEIIVNPKIDTSYSETYDRVIQNVIRFFADSIDLFGEGDKFQSVAQTLLGWLIGDRDRQFAGSEEDLTIKYIGDAPKFDLGMSATLDDFLPSSINQPLNSGNLSKIDHIVVLMMENRSFDHMLGYLSLSTTGENGLVGRGRTEVDGLKGHESNPLTAAGNETQSIFPLNRPMSQTTDYKGYRRGTKFVFDPGHSYSSTVKQRGKYDGLGGNEGFIIDFANRLSNMEQPDLSMGDEIILRREIMGYHPQEHVPVYDYLANEFGICDRWFAALPTSTWPNRFVTLTGRLAPGANGLPDLSNPKLSTFDPLEIPTIFDYLSEQEVSWKYFEHDFSFLRVFSKYTMDTENIVSMDDPEHGFYALARRGALPSVTFIEPDLTNIPPSTDDHPPTDIQNGQIFIKQICNALRSSPNWSKTLFLITYDEHGGFYDHVCPESKQLFNSDQPEQGGFVPLAYVPRKGRPYLDYQPEPIDFYGMRVPTFVISPWVPKATVSKTELDHTSILKTIIRRFMPDQPPYMGARVALANDVEEMLSLDRPRQITQMPEYGLSPDLTYESVLLSEPDSDDFHTLMTELKKKLRYKNVGFQLSRD